VEERVNQDTVDLERRIRVVVTGDNHLSAYLPRLTPAKQAERRERLRAGFGAAVRHAIVHHAHCFISTGDLFDTPTPNNQDRAFVADALSHLCQAGITTIGVSGNHDSSRVTLPQGGEAPQSVYAALNGLHYFPRHDRLIPELFEMGGLSVAVAGLSNVASSVPGSDPLSAAHLEDPSGVLSRAGVAMLILHAGIEGLCRPGEGERLVRRESILALPENFRLIVLGHIHRFGQERIGERQVVSPGATERMELGDAEGGSGFVWLELDQRGVQRIDHVSVPEQPRADLIISTNELWPHGGPAHLPDIYERPIADAAMEAMSPHPDTALNQPDPMDRIRRILSERLTSETMAKLHLVGLLTSEQYHQLVTRDILAYGRQHAFSFDLDTSELRLTTDNIARTEQTALGGSISPLEEVQAVLDERLADISAQETARAEDERAAALLLCNRLQSAMDWEAGQ
jgi:DNA repair exonuclease SbcCD nuclease subunit